MLVDALVCFRGWDHSGAQGSEGPTLVELICHWRGDVY